jgi:DNA repair protein RadA/Sms
MARAQSRYVCQECGAVSGKWTGRCESCGSWNSIVEEAADAGPGGGPSLSRGGRPIAFVGLSGKSQPPPRMTSGIDEFDRVSGGGLVPGSAVLIAGDPGIGKSTLLLQAMAALTANGVRCAYVSGEESVDQVRLRAARMGLAGARVELAAATSLRDILAGLEKLKAPGVVVIDSIQTMFVDSLESAPGTVAQVRGAAQALIRLAKARGFALLLVGHVTKEGLIAGPKVLEHMVDCVLTFEGERGHQFRILRAVKNRFGATNEIGVFEMTDQGLQEVPNPSALFLAERGEAVAGAAVFAGMEGSRPLLVEIQALVSPSPLATPRRAVVGWDAGRLAMILAVLEARCGLVIAGQEVYLNVAGGLRIGEPAADLAVAAALVSALEGIPVPDDSVIFGEIGLSGEVRAVGQSEARLKEAKKLGFRTAILPQRRRASGKRQALEGMELREMSHLSDLVAEISAGPRIAPRAQPRRVERQG